MAAAKETKKITATYLTTQLTKRVKVFAAKQGRTVSEVVGSALSEYLDRNEGTKKKA